jgi:SAM-dependent methyltransferase
MDATHGYNTLKTRYDKIRANFFNKEIEVPAIRKFIGKVKGKKVLDIGCATGTVTRMLQRHGADVTGVDISKEMIRIARSRNPRVPFHIANMKHLPFRAKTFDALFYSLSIHYERDLVSVFREAARVLKHRGRMVISTHNPYCTGQRMVKIGGIRHYEIGDYFSANSVEMSLGDIRFVIHPQTISGLFNPIIRNGFQLTEVYEPRPLPKARKINPQYYDVTHRRPHFIVIEAVKVA